MGIIIIIVGVKVVLSVQTEIGGIFNLSEICTTAIILVLTAVAEVM